MRRALPFLLVFSLLFVVGCAPMINVESLQLTGSGKLAQQDFSFDKVDRLMVGSNFKATFTVGDKVSVQVNADDNVMEYVYVHVAKGELRVEMKPGRGYSLTKVTLQAEVTMPAPRTVTVQDNAALDLGSGLRASDLSVYLYGNALLMGKDASIPRLSFTVDGNAMGQLSGAVAELTVDAKGNGKFVGPNVQVHTAKITLHDNAGATLNVTDRLDYNVSGNSAIVYTGTPQLGKQTREDNAMVIRK